MRDGGKLASSARKHPHPPQLPQPPRFLDLLNHHHLAHLNLDPLVHNSTFEDESL
jgi:hypothetical protein